MISRRLFSISAASLLAGFVTASATTTPALAATDIKFTLDWKFEGPAAGFFLAIDNGHFQAEGLNVTIDTGNGSDSASFSRCRSPSAQPATPRLRSGWCGPSPCS